MRLSRLIERAIESYRSRFGKVNFRSLLMRIAARNGSAAEGRLCIGAVSSLAGGTAHALLRAFLCAHPDVDLDLVEAPSNANFARARALRIDAVIAAGTGPFAGLNVAPLWQERINVALPRVHPLSKEVFVSWDQIADARFIVTEMDPGPEIQDFVICHLAGLGRRPIVEPRAVLREGLLALVGLGLGISLVGTAETAVAYPDVVFRALADEWLPFSLAWASNNDNPALRRFLSLARAEVRRLPSLRKDGVIWSKVSSRSLDLLP